MSSTKIPSLIYGTAWKQAQTPILVSQALQAGFRAIDTAAQPKHYSEDLVGVGIRQALNPLNRSDLYIQTKFTSIHGQDPSKGIPYDVKASITDQVNSSIASSLRNLHHSETEDAYLDCLVLHSPFPSSKQTQEAWRAMETYVPHSIRTLGISNCYDLPVLQELYDFARIKPSVVQNRFYAETGYDVGIRAYCAEKGMTYQTFWTLTANPALLRSGAVATVSKEVGVSKAVALYSVVIGLGNTSVLNGTTNAERMKEDIDGVQAVQQWSVQNVSAWEKIMESFKALLQ